MSVFGVILVRIFPHSDWISRYFVSLCIEFKCGKIQARTTPNTDTFHAVVWNMLYTKSIYIHSSHICCQTLSYTINVFSNSLNQFSFFKFFTTAMNLYQTAISYNHMENISNLETDFDIFIKFFQPVEACN